MSGILDFLFDGQQPTSTTTYGNSTTNVPTWLSDYTQGLIARGNQIAGEGYQTYEGPRVASLTPDQQKAFQLTRDSTGKYDPMVQQAGALTQTAAAGITPESIQKFQNPYADNVIKKAELEANRNYKENILPQLSNTFTASGQFGSSRMAEVANQAARDLTEGLQTNSQAALADAYKQGADISGTNVNAALQGGQNLGALATTGQNLDLKDAAALESIGGTQQNQNQTNLNTAYGDFQNQTNYNKDTLNWLSSIIRGIQTPTSTTSQQTTNGTTQGASGLSQVLGAVNGISGLMGLFGDKKAEGGAVRYADGGSVYDSPIMNKGDKKYPLSSGALTTLSDPVAPPVRVASKSGPEMTEDWYNNYGTGPEHLFYQAPMGKADITGYSSGLPLTDTGGGSSGGGLGLSEIISGIKSGKNLYDQGSKLYDKITGNGALSNTVNSQTQVADPTITNLDDLAGMTPSLDIANSTAGLSSIASPTLGALTGIGSATGVGAANTAAQLGAGYSNAATTVGSQFGTTATEAGLNAGSTAGSSTAGTLSTVAPYLGLLADAYGLADMGSAGGKSSGVTQVNPYQNITDISGHEGIVDDSLGFGVNTGSTGSLFGQAYGGTEDTSGRNIWMQDSNGNWTQASPEVLGPLISTFGNDYYLSGQNLQPMKPVDLSEFGGSGKGMYDPQSGKLYADNGKIYVYGNPLTGQHGQSQIGTNLYGVSGYEDAAASPGSASEIWSQLSPEVQASLTQLQSQQEDADPLLKAGFNYGGGSTNPMDLYNQYGASKGVDYLTWVSRMRDLLGSWTPG